MGVLHGIFISLYVFVVFSVSAHAWDGDKRLVAYEIYDDKTVVRGKNLITHLYYHKSDESYHGNDYVAEITIRKKNKIKEWDKIIKVWFDSNGELQHFRNIIELNSEIDLYYNFTKSDFNSIGSSDMCAIPFLGLFCRSKDVTVIENENINGEDLWIYDFNRDSILTIDDYKIVE